MSLIQLIASRILLKILLLNSLLVVFTGSFAGVKTIGQKTIPYILGAIMYSLYKNPTNMKLLLDTVVSVYFQRLVWEIIVVIYMTK